MRRRGRTHLEENWETYAVCLRVHRRARTNIAHRQRVRREDCEPEFVGEAAPVERRRRCL